MGKSKASYYAVARGRKVGIFNNWEECKAQVIGAPGALHKSFKTHAEAHQYILQLNGDYRMQHEKGTVPQTQPSGQASESGSRSRASSVIEDEDDIYDYPADFSLDPVERNQGCPPTVIRHPGREIAVKKESIIEAAKRSAAKEPKSDGAIKKEELSSYESAAMALNSSPASKRSAESEADSSKSNKKSKMRLVDLELSSKSVSDLIKIKDGEVRTIEVYTDGASSNNGRPNASAGYGVYWPEGEKINSDLHGLNQSKRLPGLLQTNNRAELMAIICAIRVCPDRQAQLIIYSDSKYCIKAIDEWQINWRKNHWKRSNDEPVINRDLIRRLEREMRDLLHRPTLVHVKGHSSSRGNIEADKLAVMGAKLPLVPQSEWESLEPPPSDVENDEQNHGKAVQYWVKAGFTKEEATSRAGPSSSSHT